MTSAEKLIAAFEQRKLILTIDESTFSVQLGQLPSSKIGNNKMFELLKALGKSPRRCVSHVDIAEQLGREVRSLAPTRGNLIGKGMVWSPSHGDTAFTVPLFDQFMKRTMPDVS